MKSFLKAISFAISLCSVTSSGYSQETEKKPGIISFYLDCFHCDFDFVRQEMPFVSFVRDPTTC